jgi:uncharacterized GH25 family protein
LKAFRWLAGFALALGAAPLLAHDLWIEPTSFSPRAGEVVGLRLRVGMNLAGDPVPRIPALIRELIVEGDSGRQAIRGREGADPAGILRAAPGVQVLGYFSNPSWIELPAEKFNEYLKEEGLDAVLALRARRNESGEPGREAYSRCAKSLLVSGAHGGGRGDRPLGFPLELVAERNPYELEAGEDLPVRLLWQDHPLAGALVVAMNRGNPAEKLSARTDAEGRVRFRIESGGFWLIKAVHMVRAPEKSPADWQSYWASLTFEARARDAYLKR